MVTGLQSSYVELSLVLTKYMIMKKIKALLLMAIPVLLLSCGDGTNRNTNRDDDTRGTREYNRENDMDNTRDRDMDNTRDRDLDNTRDRDLDNTRDRDMNRGTNQGADRDTIGQDL
jgi:hypothetical protein